MSQQTKQSKQSLQNLPAEAGTLSDHYLPQVRRYLHSCRPPLPGCADPSEIAVQPLAQGEYNLNFLLSRGCAPAVFRINIASQLKREDQICYEYHALELLRDSGVTPCPYYLDNSRKQLDRGILIMEYLEGRPLHYPTDTPQAASLFSTLHQLRPSQPHQLIREEQPLSLIFAECSELLKRYFQSRAAAAAPEIGGLLAEILAWADGARHRERYFESDPFNCIVNTEVNSGNFIVNPQQGSIHLIDWEMPRWGDPSSDLCHFISPLTTLWRSSHRLDTETRAAFVRTYLDGFRGREGQRLAATIHDRLELKMPFVLLRGIAWSAMAWAAYQTYDQGDYQGIRNQQTWQVLNRYLEPAFIRALFAPYLHH
ncbi:phosphotransferase family protein [Desulfogranum mediterraneum]|uniref:phosphotransferase family protein n=1 Tax=Desulfogranum mediterraneum TaxID=160661 RepID=UPI00040BA7B5|nr:aminoglycoside phosphotransferase family protein [Desulfogranum mediterraneum]